MAEHLSIYERVLQDPDLSLTADSVLPNAYNVLAADPLDRDSFWKEKERLEYEVRCAGTFGMSDRERERIIDMRALEGILLGSRRDSDTLRDWQLYARLFNKYGAPLEGGRALMLGAMGALSARAFTVFAHEVYKADQPLIIDLVGGKDKVGHGTFVYGDALAMPFRSGTIDLVHTSQLFHKLQGPKPWQEAASCLMQEMGRVTTGSGQVLMREVHPGQRSLPKDILTADSAFGQFLNDQLQMAGFGEVDIETTQRAVDYDYIFYKDRDILQTPTTPAPLTLSVYARK